MLYSAYDLTLDSALALPELRTAAAAETPASADVLIRIGKAPLDEAQNTRQCGPFLWTGPDAMWFEVPKVARFLVRHGQTIDIEPAAGIDEDSLRLFLLGSALGALMMQRGLLVLHGNAIRIGDGCVICVGHSGAGKSTLAAALAKRGYEVLADDVVPINESGEALPGFPRVKLWQDAAKQLGIDTSGLARIRPNLNKFNWTLPDAGIDTSISRPAAVTGIYVLSSADRSGIELKPIKGVERFKALRRNTYRSRFLAGGDHQRQHLASCGRVATQARFGHITRPRYEFLLDDLVEKLIADVNEAR